MIGFHAAVALNNKLYILQLFLLILDDLFALMYLYTFIRRSGIAEKVFFLDKTKILVWNIWLDKNMIFIPWLAKKKIVKLGKKFKLY